MLSVIGTLLLHPESSEPLLQTIERKYPTAVVRSVSRRRSRMYDAGDDPAWRECAVRLLVAAFCDSGPDILRGIGRHQVGSLLPWPACTLVICRSMERAKEAAVEPFDLKDMPGDGHCFFHAVATAVMCHWTVHRLRTLVAEAATQDQFDSWKLMHDEAERELAASPASQDARELAGEFGFMRGVTTMEQLRDAILTNRFWGEGFSINTLQKALHVEIIVRDSKLRRKHTGADDPPSPLLGRLAVVHHRGHYMLLGSPSSRYGTGIQWCF